MMTDWQKAQFDRLHRVGYLTAFSGMVQGHCAPFWWHGLKDGAITILQNGTVTFLDTGTARIGVTADHVYQRYLEHKDAFAGFTCQFGGTPHFDPTDYLLDRDADLDLATFRIPDVLLAPTLAYYHTPLTWPPAACTTKDVVVYGGYPGLLRTPQEAVADFPFQYFATAVNDVSAERIALHPNFAHLHWPGHEDEKINEALGGQSGGPVFRIIDGPPIDRIEIVGFIYEYNSAFELMLSRPVSVIAADGMLVRASR